jgi:hypothetical protein
MSNAFWDDLNKDLNNSEFEKAYHEAAVDIEAHDVEYEERIAQELEASNIHRGLRFTSVFQGLVPVQAYGIVDGKRFYFRQRNGLSYLVVGEFDYEVDWAEVRERDVQLRMQGYPIVLFHTVNRQELYPNVNVVRLQLVTDARTDEMFQRLLDAL